VVEVVEVTGIAPIQPMLVLVEDQVAGVAEIQMYSTVVQEEVLVLLGRGMQADQVLIKEWDRAYR
jgi:hypothetical protein